MECLLRLWPNLDTLEVAGPHDFLAIPLLKLLRGLPRVRSCACPLGPHPPGLTLLAESAVLHVQHKLPNMRHVVHVGQLVNLCEGLLCSN
jgi:hypothetical protein